MSCCFAKRLTIKNISPQQPSPKPQIVLLNKKNQEGPNVVKQLQHGARVSEIDDTQIKSLKANNIRGSLIQRSPQRRIPDFPEFPVINTKTQPIKSFYFDMSIVCVPELKAKKEQQVQKPANDHKKQILILDSGSHSKKKITEVSNFRTNLSTENNEYPGTFYGSKLNQQNSKLMKNQIDCPSNKGSQNYDDIDLFQKSIRKEN